VLLDLLSRQPELRLTVAHFDHGIRPDSGADRLFVQALAKKYGWPFVYDAAQLGPGDQRSHRPPSPLPISGTGASG